MLEKGILLSIFNVSFIIVNSSLLYDSSLVVVIHFLQRLLAHFYMEGPDAMKFDEEFQVNSAGSPSSSSTHNARKGSSISLWEKLQASLTPNLPRDLQSIEGQSMTQIQVQQQALSHFWAFLKGLLIPSNASNKT